MITNPDEYLSRSDKWFVGGGTAALWAPCFPIHLDTLGFWDYGYYLDQKLPHIFTITVLDEQLNPINFNVTERVWRPSSFSQKFVAEDLSIGENKLLTPTNVFVSQMDIVDNGSKDRRCHFIMWTKLDRRPPKPMPIRLTYPFDYEGLTYTNPEIISNSAVFSQEELHTNSECNYRVWYALGAKEELDSYTINLCENFHMSLGSLEDRPLWIVTPFPEKIYGGKFKNENIPEKPFSEFGSIYVGLHYTIDLQPELHNYTWFACGVSHIKDKCLNNLKDLQDKNPLELSRQNWRDFLNSVPSFECSDPYITKYYWYRWYGLKLNMINVGENNHKYPIVYEGIGERDGGWFRHHISYSAQCHMIECSWMHNPSVAKGSLLGLLSNIHENGAIPGGVGFKGKTDDWFIYHANYAKGILQIYQIHPDIQFFEQIYEPLARYAKYFDRQRDPEGSSLYDVIQQYETGQEYNARYLFAEENADRDVTFKLKGVDATTYIYELKKLLAFMAQKLGKKEESEKWATEAEKIKENMLKFMWNPEEQFFFDVKPENFEPSNVKAAVCFYPFMTDIVDSHHLGAIRKHLLNPKEFWTPYPVPTLSKDHPLFNSEAEWKGIRKYCPWNGRVWPMTNSHICDALAQTAYHMDTSLKIEAAQFLSKFIRMMFFKENPELPNCYEHYNPFTGYPSSYRGVDDYMHSWVVDLIIRYIAGFQPQTENVVVLDPLPLNLEHFTLNNLSYKGHKIKITWRKEKIDQEKKGFCLYINEKLVAQRKQLEKIRVKINSD
ncbi:MAG: amylo-alpha-1,6-glucosidase [Candidatus Freyarchaeota archaeon]